MTHALARLARAVDALEGAAQERAALESAALERAADTDLDPARVQGLASALQASEAECQSLREAGHLAVSQIDQTIGRLRELLVP